MSNFKTTFTLKQHTPIIHFQSNQAGATLRATELKPKFDRFLKQYAFGGNIPQKYKIVEDKEAIDYKVKIEVSNITKDSITQKIKKWNNKEKKEKISDEGFPTFFATMGDEWKKNPKYFIHSDTIKIEIISFHTDLIQTIKEYFPKFIFETNFGTRQSKGFGSFSVIERNGKKYEYENLNYYNFTIDLNNNIDNKLFPNPKYVQNPSKYYIKQKKLFTIIDIFYKSLRSGINQQGFYFKSLLFMYAKSKGINWDKKYLKQQFVNLRDLEEQRRRHNNPDILNYNNLQKNQNVFMVRDILGLATNQAWMKYKFNLRHPKKGDKINNKKINENEIQRIKSPITIKPIDIGDNKFQIYIILNEINSEIFKYSFTILKTTGRGKYERIEKNINDFKMWKGFDLNDYFNFIIKFDIQSHIKKKNNHFAKLLLQIYKDLKAQQ